MIRLQPLGRLRILVVEDEYFIADDLAKALGAEGTGIVGPVGNLAAAAKHVAEDGFDVAALDLNPHGEMAYTGARSQ